jgi:hypothetical protein
MIHHEQTPATERADPDAGALVESLRGLGYSLETALADLIDNSITANAKTIWVNFWWNGEASAILVEDDGEGMEPSRLSQAMRLGSQAPGLDRGPKDLGRFGLGLKTASMSQCRRFTVRTSSVSSNDTTTRCWDLDFIESSKDWLLLKEVGADTEALLAKLRQHEGHGTLVLWERLDRLVGAASREDNAAHGRFLEHIEQVVRHLGVVFHRFLEGKGGLRIVVNGEPVLPWDPFLKGDSQELGSETLRFRDAEVTVKPYVLPHHSKIKKEVHEQAAGIHGWNASQGFYVYRAKRLLVAGDWLNLSFQKEEHAKLARIQVDLPNSMDQDWKLDVRKARARPPAVLRSDLKRIAKVTRERAVAVYRHRGKIIDRVISVDSYVWHHKSKGGMTFFELNRGHPLVAELMGEAEPTRTRVKRLLRLIEETVPIPTMALLMSQAPDSAPIPYSAAPLEEVEALGRKIFDALRSAGWTASAAAERLRTLEPFPLYEPLLERLILELLDHG